MSFNIEVKGKYLLSHKNRMGIFNLDEEVHVCRLILQKNMLMYMYMYIYAANENKQIKAI